MVSSVFKSYLKRHDHLKESRVFTHPILKFPLSPLEGKYGILGAGFGIQGRPQLEFQFAAL